jgi:oligopeptide/dipeptide ABC transporter ATP-binding protein
MALLDIKNLTVSFRTEHGRVLATDNVSLHIDKGETVGLVGESGSGKSVTAMSILRLIPSPPGVIESGEAHFEGQDLLKLSLRDLRNVRGSGIAVIFQEPMTALSPLHRIGKQLAEGLHFHSDIDKRSALATAHEWLGKVGIPDPDTCMQAYPYELSGGMRQRVMIAMALMLEPKLIIADEPTTALDVTVQAQILELMRDMKSDDTSILLITHDMGVIWEMCDRVAVMYASELVETGDTKTLFDNAQHPYTQALLKAVPPAQGHQERLATIEGQVPSSIAYPQGCRFQERCDQAFAKCGQSHPKLFDTTQGQARCFLRDTHE